MSKKPVVIITGVSSGIGLAAAALFAQKGWLVVGTVRRRPYPVELSALAVDIQMAEMTNPADLRRVVRKTVETYGRIDAVVANAGYALLGPLEKLSYDQINQQLAVNVGAVAELTRLVLPIMRKRRRGVIVAVSSIAGRLGLPEYSAYCASKFALEGLFEALRYEVAEFGIKVRLVEPSVVKTPFWNKAQALGTQAMRQLAGRSRGSRGLSAPDVAQSIYRAATDRGYKLHYPVGLTGVATAAKRLVPDRWFYILLKWAWQRLN